MSLIERALKKADPDEFLEGSSKPTNQRSKNKKTALKSRHDLENMAEPLTLSHNELQNLGIATDRATVNAFRELRTNLVKAAGGKNFVLAVSSCKSESGNSFIALNLAASFSQDVTKSALIIDCSFRNPTIANSLDIKVNSDLTDYLTKDLPIEDIIYKVKINKLRVIPCKESNLSEIDSFTTSSKLGELIYELKNKYPDRYIILDVSDIHSSADAKILDLIADHSVLVAGYDTVSQEELRNAVDGFNPSKFLGIIYNNR